jgi:hypothetical protein
MHHRKHISRDHHPPLSDVTADTKKTASCLVACWTVFTELLPGNAFVKSVTLLFFCNVRSKMHVSHQFQRSQIASISAHDVHWPTGGFVHPLCIVISLHRARPSHYEVTYAEVFCLTVLPDDLSSFAVIGEALEYAVNVTDHPAERLLVSFCPSVSLSIFSNEMLETV